MKKAFSYSLWHFIVPCVYTLFLLYTPYAACSSHYGDEKEEYKEEEFMTQQEEPTFLSQVERSLLSPKHEEDFKKVSLMASLDPLIEEEISSQEGEENPRIDKGHFIELIREFHLSPIVLEKNKKRELTHYSFKKQTKPRQLFWETAYPKEISLVPVKLYSAHEMLEEMIKRDKIRGVLEVVAADVPILAALLARELAQYDAFEWVLVFDMKKMFTLVEEQPYQDQDASRIFCLPGFTWQHLMLLLEENKGLMVCINNHLVDSYLGHSKSLSAQYGLYHALIESPVSLLFLQENVLPPMIKPTDVFSVESIDRTKTLPIPSIQEKRWLKQSSALVPLWQYPHYASFSIFVEQHIQKCLEQKDPLLNTSALPFFSVYAFIDFFIEKQAWEKNISPLHFHRFLAFKAIQKRITVLSPDFIHEQLDHFPLEKEQDDVDYMLDVSFYQEVLSLGLLKYDKEGATLPKRFIQFLDPLLQQCLAADYIAHVYMEKEENKEIERCLKEWLATPLRLSYRHLFPALLFYLYKYAINDQMPKHIDTYWQDVREKNMATHELPRALFQIACREAIAPSPFSMTGEIKFESKTEERLLQMQQRQSLILKVWLQSSVKEKDAQVTKNQITLPYLPFDAEVKALLMYTPDFLTSTETDIAIRKAINAFTWSNERPAQAYHQAHKLATLAQAHVSRAMNSLLIRHLKKLLGCQHPLFGSLVLDISSYLLDQGVDDLTRSVWLTNALEWLPHLSNDELKKRCYKQMMRIPFAAIVLLERLLLEKNFSIQIPLLAELYEKSKKEQRKQLLDFWALRMSRSSFSPKGLEADQLCQAFLCIIKKVPEDAIDIFILADKAKLTSNYTKWVVKFLFAIQGAYSGVSSLKKEEMQLIKKIDELIKAIPQKESLVCQAEYKCCMLEQTYSFKLAEEYIEDLYKIQEKMPFWDLLRKIYRTYPSLRHRVIDQVIMAQILLFAQDDPHASYIASLEAMWQDIGQLSLLQKEVHQVLSPQKEVNEPSLRMTYKYLCNVLASRLKDKNVSEREEIFMYRFITQLICKEKQQAKMFLHMVIKVVEHDMTLMKQANQNDQKKRLEQKSSRALDLCLSLPFSLRDKQEEALEHFLDWFLEAKLSYSFIHSLFQKLTRQVTQKKQHPILLLDLISHFCEQTSDDQARKELLSIVSSISCSFAHPVYGLAASYWMPKIIKQEEDELLSVEEMPRLERESLALMIEKASPLLYEYKQKQKMFSYIHSILKQLLLLDAQKYKLEDFFTLWKGAIKGLTHLSIDSSILIKKDYEELIDTMDKTCFKLAQTTGKTSILLDFYGLWEKLICLNSNPLIKKSVDHIIKHLFTQYKLVNNLNNKFENQVDHNLYVRINRLLDLLCTAFNQHPYSIPLDAMTLVYLLAHPLIFGSEEVQNKAAYLSIDVLKRVDTLLLENNEKKTGPKAQSHLTKTLWSVYDEENPLRASLKKAFSEVKTLPLPQNMSDGVRGLLYHMARHLIRLTEDILSFVEKHQKTFHMEDLVHFRWNSTMLACRIKAMEQQVKEENIFVVRENKKNLLRNLPKRLWKGVVEHLITQKKDEKLLDSLASLLGDLQVTIFWPHKTVKLHNNNERYKKPFIEVLKQGGYPFEENPLQKELPEPGTILNNLAVKLAVNRSETASLFKAIVSSFFDLVGLDPLMKLDQDKVKVYVKKKKKKNKDQYLLCLDLPVKQEPFVYMLHVIGLDFPHTLHSSTFDLGTYQLLFDVEAFITHIYPYLIPVYLVE